MSAMGTGRVYADYGSSYDVWCEGKLYRAALRGHFHTGAYTGFPKVGDYVTLEPAGAGRAVISEVLPRENAIVRLAPHDQVPQVMVANVDYLLIVMGLDADFNIARLERYMALARQSEVAPVIVLNKADVLPDTTEVRAAVTAVAGAIPTHVVSAETGVGMDALLPYVAEGKTVVLLGSSGAGKSTITNWFLAADAQETNTQRERDGRGRHTTTTRQLFMLPTGGFLIDTPGIRELALLSDEDAAADAFADIDALADRCRFSNCDHEKSAGCAIVAAVAAGTLDPKRYERYLRLKRGDARLRRTRY